MDQKVSRVTMLLVKTLQDDSLKVVSAMEEKGELKTVPPRKEHEKDFMKIDKHSDVLENFGSSSNPCWWKDFIQKFSKS